MREISVRRLIEEYSKHGYQLQDVTLTGWRNLNGRVNHFDDFISVYNYVTGEFSVYSATTMPGIFWLKKLLNPKGTAILAPGQYHHAYAVGYYRDRLALRQVRPVTVYRDYNLDDKYDIDESTIERGLFGLHIHGAGNRSSFVDVWSAGCQVFQKYDDLLDMCTKFLSNLNKYTYTLLEI